MILHASAYEYTTRFFTNISRAVAWDDCSAGVAIKSSYPHPWCYLVVLGPVVLSAYLHLLLWHYSFSLQMQRLTSIHCWYRGIWYLCYECICVLVCSWPILFKVFTLNVAICIVSLHSSNFCFSLSSVADFSNTGARVPASAGRDPFLPMRRAMWFGQVVWVWTN